MLFINFYRFKSSQIFNKYYINVIEQTSQSNLIYFIKEKYINDGVYILLLIN